MKSPVLLHLQMARRKFELSNSYLAMPFPITLIRLSSFSIHPVCLSQALLLQVPCDVGAEPWRFCSFTQKEAQQKNLQKNPIAGGSSTRSPHYCHPLNSSKRPKQGRTGGHKAQHAPQANSANTAQRWLPPGILFFSFLFQLLVARTILI